jgi:hypothetical protein
VSDFCDKPADASQADINCCDPTAPRSCSQDRSASYGYDGLDRLTLMSSPYGKFAASSHAYDDAGNLSSKEGQSQSYDAGAGPHALTTAGETAFGYDAVGNMTACSDGLT